MGAEVPSTTGFTEGCSASILDHPPVFQVLLEVSEALAVPVDWVKSYFRSPDAGMRTWWCHNRGLFLPAGTMVPVVNHTNCKELGHTCPLACPLRGRDSKVA